LFDAKFLRFIGRISKVEEVIQMSQHLERKLLVLTFHRVDDDRLLSSHGVPWEWFLRLLDRIGVLGVKVVSTFLPEEIKEPSILLRFDDGTTDHLRAAMELSRRGLSGVFFVSSGHLGKPAYLDSQEVRQMHHAGHVIGSHSHTHIPLPAQPAGSVHDELHRSKAILEDVTGQAVDFLAPPGGFVDSAVRNLAKEVGYSALTTVRWGLCSGWWDSYDVPALAMTPWTIRRKIAERTYARGALPWEARGVNLLKVIIPAPVGRHARTILNARVAKIGRFTHNS
jgi:peptidoglycan/xylan/chitin deacetylase (PgdA/CDA1 family)